MFFDFEYSLHQYEVQNDQTNLEMQKTVLMKQMKSVNGSIASYKASIKRINGQLNYIFNQAETLAAK